MKDLTIINSSGRTKVTSFKIKTKDIKIITTQTTINSPIGKINRFPYHFYL